MQLQQYTGTGQGNLLICNSGILNGVWCWCRIVLVFGCEGERDQAMRPFMGEVAHYKVRPEHALCTATVQTQA